MLETELISAGFSLNEAKIYLYLLKNPNTTSGPIIKGTNIVNSRVYASISSLVEKGFVKYNIQKDGKHFFAESPETIRSKENERMDKINSIIPQLKKITKEDSSKVSTSIYEGFDGFKTAFKKIIDECPKGGTIFILGFSESAFATKSLRTFLSNMNLKSAQKKQNLKILLDVESKFTLGEDRANEPYTEIKYMPKGYISPTAIDIFEDNVCIFLWEEKPFVFWLKNKKIAESFKQYFNFLWKLGK